MLPDPDGFSSFAWWHAHRDDLVFRDAASRDDWQRRCLARLVAQHGVGRLADIPVGRAIPPHASPGGEEHEIRTSGTVSRTGRSFRYQDPQFAVIQAHQWWRIERAHGLERPGIVAEIGYNPFYTMDASGRYHQARLSPGASGPATRPLARPETHVYGPATRLQVGAHNRHYEWMHSRYTTAADWEVAWGVLRGLRPKVVVMAPSQFQAAWPAVRDLRPFDCPVVMTCETLDATTRDLASRLFSRVIDKMRCWDGGLGFFECREGRKHVYDELALVERVDGVLASTDFFNFCHPFFRYANGDEGVLDEGRCDCGTFGRHFSDFQGRVVQRVVIDGETVPGNALSAEVFGFLAMGWLPSYTASKALVRGFGAHPFDGVAFRWQVRQDAAGDFEFRYDADLDARQLEYLGVGVRFILLRQGLPLGPLDAVRSCDHRLALVRDPGLSDSRKNLSVVSEVPA